jgi:hypothetical protein
MEQQLISTLFGSDVVIIAIIISVIGIGIRTGMGMVGKPLKEFSFSITAISFVIGFLAASQLVVVAIENLPVGATPGVLFSLVIGQILTVMGLDAGVKTIGKKVSPLIKKEII